MMERLYRVINATTGQVLFQRARIAQDFKSRSVGLLNRSSLDEDEALLIKPCNAIHTFFMKFPIDIAFLDKNGKVVKARANLGKNRLCSAMLHGYMVLEMSAGSLAKIELNQGNVLKIE
ncbi:MAG: DUF192 domain-containing protein [Candidatus Omnitrophota bacterium]